MEGTDRLIQKCKRLWQRNKGAKWKYSFYSALVFFVVASPQAYEISQQLLGTKLDISNNGAPTAAGLMLHTVVFMIALYGMMNLPD